MTTPAQIGRVRPLTPKEFAAALGGLRNAAWVRREIRAARIRVISYVTVRRGRRCQQIPRAPYLIPACELARFRPPLPWALVA